VNQTSNAGVPALRAFTAAHLRERGLEAFVSAQLVELQRAQHRGHEVALVTGSAQVADELAHARDALEPDPLRSPSEILQQPGLEPVATRLVDDVQHGRRVGQTNGVGLTNDVMEVLAGARDDWREAALRGLLLRFALLAYSPVAMHFRRESAVALT
jgi:hypothetical protein